MDPNIPSTLQKIYNRAVRSGLKAEPYRFSLKKDIPKEDVPVTGLLLFLPNGKTTRPFLVKDDDRLRKNSKHGFEDMQFISGLEATWSREDDVLEAELQGDDLTYNASTLIKRLKCLFRASVQDTPGSYNTLVMPYRRRQVEVVFGESTELFTFLTNYKGYRKKPVIRITGTGARTHDEARSSLLYISDALLFQIDREYNIPLRIRSERFLFSEHRKRRLLNTIPVKLSPPPTTYNTETMTMYWNARMSTNNPLAQYLYFYQIMEHHFSSIKGKTDRGTKPLKKLLEETVYAKNVLNFLLADTERELFFKTPKLYSQIDQTALVGICKNQTFLDAVANRIYSIRNKIVHSQKERKTYLLPYSKAIGDIYHDLCLIEFVSKEIILAKDAICLQGNASIELRNEARNNDPE